MKQNILRSIPTIARNKLPLINNHKYRLEWINKLQLIAN